MTKILVYKYRIRPLSTLKQQLILCCSLGLFALTTSFACAQMPLSERITRTEEAVKNLVGAEKTNDQKMRNDRLNDLRHATEESLKSPRVVSGLYGPQYAVAGKVHVIIFWIENVPTLTDIIVRNPENGKELRLPVTTFFLDDAKKSSTFTVMYGCSVELDLDKLDVVGHESQTLELMAKGQDTPATLYPTVPKGESTKKEEKN